MGGFAAASYLRGIQVAQVPTSLLAMSATATRKDVVYSISFAHMLNDWYMIGGAGRKLFS